MRDRRSIFAVGAAVAACAGAGKPAQAQYVNPHTGTNWNNPMSSTLDTAIIGMRNSAMLRNSLNANMAASGASAAYTRKVRVGAAKIKAGRATTRFSAVAPFNLEEWLTRCGAKTPEQRRQYGEEIRLQRRLLDEEARAFGADRGDMAPSLGLCFAMAWEAYTGGQRATEKQYRWLVNDFRRTLLKDAYFQGMNAAEKQYLFEENMINATDALRLWRESRLAGDEEKRKRAREGAARFLARWWDEPVENLTAAEDRFTSRR